MSARSSLLVFALVAIATDASLAQPPSREARRAPAAAPAATADAGATTATALEAGVPEETPEDRARRARVYARFGDERVTVGEIEDAIAEQSPFQRQRYLTDRARLRELAQRLVETKLLAAEARRVGLGRQQKVRDVVREASVQLLIRREFDERITPQSITDADAQGYYQSHIDEFSRPEMVRASHIVVATEADARALLAEIATADAARFRQLARERSLDEETKLAGGDLRYFTRDGRAVGGRERPVDTAIVAAAFGIGEVGGVVASPVPVGSRFSVVKLTGRRQAETTPFEQAREGIRRRLWRERRQAAIETFVAELRRRGNVTTNTERLRAIRLDEPEAVLGDGHAHGAQEDESPAPTMRPATSMSPATAPSSP